MSFLSVNAVFGYEAGSSTKAAGLPVYAAYGRV